MAVTADADAHVRIVSYNMHGFFQGSPAVTDIISQHCPDVINLQEHWLTPYNLNKYDILMITSALDVQLCQKLSRQVSSEVGPLVA